VLQSDVERAFSCSSLRRRSLCIILKNDDQWIPRLTWNFSDCLVALPDSATATQLCRRYHQYVHCVWCLSTVPNFNSSLLILFFAQALLRNFVTNCRAFVQVLYIHRDFWSKFCVLYWTASTVKIAAFAWYSIKIRIIFGVWFERWKVDKKANLHENWNMQTLF